MTENKVTNMTETQNEYIKSTISHITQTGKNMYEPYGRILALKNIELSLLKLIEEINIEIKKQEAIVDKYNKKLG
tara:strand:+ start:374 stop:598 length:225 start_codon:yes stop_codon:yes gene_type:complete